MRYQPVYLNTDVLSNLVSSELHNIRIKTMDILTQTVLLGALVFILWKLGVVLLKHIQLCKALQKFPQKSSHWLFGHSREIKDSKTYFDYVKDIMKGDKKTYCIWTGPFPVLGVCHPETFQQLNKQEINKARGLTGPYRLFEPWIGEGLLVSGDKKWERNRRLLTPAFHFDVLSGYISVMNDVTDTFLDKLGEGMEKSESIDIFPYVCRSTLDVMLRCSLSYDGSMLENENHVYIKAVQEMAALLWHRLTAPLLLFDSIYNLSSAGREHKRLIDVAHEFSADIIAKRQKLLKQEPDVTKQKRRLDFLDILLTARDEHGHGLSQQEIQDEVDTFTFEGHDTTGSAISYAIYALGQFPEIQERVYQDVQNIAGDVQDISQREINQFKYLPLFIKEAMRYYSPVPLVARQNSKQLVLDGHVIPPGLRIDINIYAIHHNKEIWKSPEKFDPIRFDSEHRDETDVYGFIPFSAGSRNCIGQVFALNEIKITLAKLVKRYIVLPVKGHQPDYQPDLIMRSLNGLPVILQRRHAMKVSDYSMHTNVQKKDQRE